MGHTAGIRARATTIDTSFVSIFHRVGAGCCEEGLRLRACISGHNQHAAPNVPPAATHRHTHTHTHTHTQKVPIILWSWVPTLKPPCIAQHGWDAGRAVCRMVFVGHAYSMVPYIGMPRSSPTSYPSLTFPVREISTLCPMVGEKGDRSAYHPAWGSPESRMHCSHAPRVLRLDGWLCGWLFRFQMHIHSYIPRSKLFKHEGCPIIQSNVEGGA